MELGLATTVIRALLAKARRQTHTAVDDEVINSQVLLRLFLLRHDSVRMWKLPVVAIGIALALAACGGGTASNGSSPTGSAAAASTGSATATVKTANSSFGQILVSGSGRTLYLFEADKGSTSTCYGGCAATWPPLLTTGAAQVAGGASQSLLGTTKRTDGTTQVTYAGHPLYYYVGDSQAGQTTGQGLNNAGGLWYVLAPQGNAITKT